MPSQQLEHKDTVGSEPATQSGYQTVNQLAIFHLLQTQHMDPRRPVFIQCTKNIYTVWGFSSLCLFTNLPGQNIARIEEIRAGKKKDNL